MMQSRLGRPSFGIWWICLLAIAVFLAKGFGLGRPVSELLITGDNDNLMRLQEVRDWLAGQSWFDTRQYRVLPPEGISIHWSRYIDAGIAAIYLPLTWIMDPARAELAAIAIWPTFLACLMILLLGHGTNALFGRAAAAGALVAFLSWGKFGGEFIPTRIDHHNLQLLGTTAVFFLSVLPGRPRWHGLLAGLTTAMTLSIGLEMLPALALIWGIAALRHAFNSPGAGDWLLFYALSLAIAAPLLLAGQTPYQDWMTNHCDELAPPVLVLAAVGIVATLAPVLAEKHLQGPISRIAVLLVLAAFGLWLASPILLPCSAGPYADMPPELRRNIEERIIEARSIAILLREDIPLLVSILLPPLVLAASAALVLGRLWRKLSPAQRLAALQALALSGVGLVFASQQIRAANLITPAAPLLAGLLFHGFARIPRDHRLRGLAVLVLVLTMPATVQMGSVALVQRLGLAPPTSMVDVGNPAANGPAAISSCRSKDAMAEIASLPPSQIFTNMGLGPAILVYTPHSVSAAPYHRSPTAYWNGAFGFDSEANLRKGLVESRADLVVICAGGQIDASKAFLKPDALPNWLVEVTEGRRLVRVFKVDQNALQATGGAP